MALYYEVTDEHPEVGGGIRLIVRWYNSEREDGHCLSEDALVFGADKTKAEIEAALNQRAQQLHSIYVAPPSGEKLHGWKGKMRMVNVHPDGNVTTAAVPKELLKEHRAKLAPPTVEPPPPPERPVQPVIVHHHAEHEHHG